MIALSVLLSLQMLPEIQDAPALLYVYGPLGIFSAFFMLMSVYLLMLGAKHVQRIEHANNELSHDFRGLAHRMAGLERALLADMVERDTTGLQTKKYCREAIARIDSQMNAATR